MFNKKLIIPTARELFQSMSTIRDDWNFKTSLQKYCYLYGVGRAACIIVQLPIYEDDQTLPMMAYQGCVYVATYFLLAIYTVYYFVMNGEFAKCLPCTCLLVGPVVSVSLQFKYIFPSQCA